MSQVQKLFFELNNERNLKEQFLRERNDLKSKENAMKETLQRALNMLVLGESEEYKEMTRKYLFDSLQALKGVETQ